LFADERGEDGLSRLTPQVPKNAIGFVAARPPEEYFPLEEFRSCCNAVLRSDGRTVLQIGSSDGYEPLKSALIDFFRDEELSARRGFARWPWRWIRITRRRGGWD
jgi:DNA-binding transcriptional MocR family regulator